ncbi:MAG: gephyrin-like molybdotransferase Glp [Chloroflexota bacterium]
MSGGLLRLEEARARMLAGLAALPAETVPVAEALGRVLAADAIARDTLPPWDNSAMDGFAVRATDVAGASADAPVRLRVIGESAAGHAPSVAVEPGTAVRVLTGAMLPDGADAVVPVEDTDAPQGVAALPDAVGVRVAAGPGAHVRRRGGDLRTGDHLLDAGTRLTPQALAVLAAAGLGEVAVHRRPRVAILGTGDELVPPGQPLGPAQISDSNSIALAAQAAAAGAEVVRLGLAPDRREVILERLRAGIAGADLVVSSGGVSVGAHDEVKEAFDEVGRMDLWRVAIQPGKPLAFGRATAPDGREVLLFGLPGNPVSSFVTFELFVRPVIRALAGHPEAVGRRMARARLSAEAHTSLGRRAFLRVRLGADPARPDDPSALVAELAGGQGSHVLSALARANGLAIIPEEVEVAPAGALVDVLRIDEEPS